VGARADQWSAYTCYKWGVAQITLYLPDELVRQLREEAEAAHKSLSAHVRDRLSRNRAGRDALVRLFGSCDLGEPPDDPPPDEIEPL
jgi:hypothetical protein